MGDMTEQSAPQPPAHAQPAAPQPAQGARSLPPAVLALAFFALTLLLIATTVQKLWSADFWWQLKLGQWMIEHRAIPRAEMFSHTAAGTTIREMRWLYCITIAWLWEHAGAAVLVILQSAVVTVCFALIIAPVRRVLTAPRAILALALALLAGFNRWVVRPELVTDIMVAAFLIILERSARDRSWKGLWLLPLLQVLWVNGHTTFLFGPVLAWTFWGADLVTNLIKRSSAPAAKTTTVRARSCHVPLLITAILTTAACWVNPFGHWGAMYALQVFTETRSGHVTAQTVIEMYSPFQIPLSAWGWDLFAGAALSLLAIATTVSARRTLPLARLAVLVMGLYLLATLQRNLGLASIMLAWVALRNLFDIHDLPSVIKIRTSQGAAIGTAILSLVIAAAAWYIATDRYSILHNLSREFGLGVVEWYQPRGAERYILEHKPEPQLFNVVRDGSYFASRVSDTLPIYIDGRTDAFASVLQEVSSVSTSNWDALAAKRSINTAVIPTRGYPDMATYLYQHPDWALVSLDPTSYVFLRNTPHNAPLVAKSRIDVARWSPPATEPDDRVPAWKAAYGGVGRAWYNAGMADALATLGGHDAAFAYYEKAVANAPNHKPTRLALAPYYIVAGKAREAEQLLQGVSPKQLAAVDRTTSSLLYSRGQLPAAIPPAERALEAAPDDHAYKVYLADLYFQTGQYDKAKKLYASALKAKVGGVNELNKLGAAADATGDIAAADAAFRASLELAPNQPDIWNMAGGTAAKMNNLTLAKTRFEKALELNPNLAQARRNLDKVNQLLAVPR
jgi:tetratricopeptide (TPR) repeat protein